METKNPTEMVLPTLDHLDYECHHLVPPTGHGAGGLALYWKQQLSVSILSSSANCIDTIIVFEGKSFHASFIYGNTDRAMRQVLWNELTVKANLRDTPWFVTGDFNDLLFASEKEGGPERPEGSFTDLRTFFSEGDLFDLQHSGDPLSWRGQRGIHFVQCRLDRAVANSLWAENYPTARFQYLPYEASDHKPLISYFEPERKKRKGLFRYDRRLKDNAEVKKLVTQTWKSMAGAPVTERIAQVRRIITEWSKL